MKEPFVNISIVGKRKLWSTEESGKDAELATAPIAFRRLHFWNADGWKVTYIYHNSNLAFLFIMKERFRMR